MWTDGCGADAISYLLESDTTSCVEAPRNLGTLFRKLETSIVLNCNSIITSLIDGSPRFSREPDVRARVAAKML